MGGGGVISEIKKGTWYVKYEPLCYIWNGPS
jgi:hypothetical protein